MVRRIFEYLLSALFLASAYLWLLQGELIIALIFIVCAIPDTLES